MSYAFKEYHAEKVKRGPKKGRWMLFFRGLPIASFTTKGNAMKASDLHRHIVSAVDPDSDVGRGMLVPPRILELEDADE